MKQIGKKTVFFFMLTVCLMFTVFLGSKRQTEASSGYVLKVNRQKNVVTVYKNNVPVRAMLCSTGRNNATPVGTYRTQGKMRWHVLDGPVYGQYCTRISGHYLFHSVYYYTMGDKTDLATSQYKKLGKQASHGCVRLSVEDAKWIYDHCSLGTKVIIYDGKEAGPLGKPKNVKLPTKNYKEKWDPTDPDSSNPYYKNRPTINTSKKSSTVVLGSTFDAKKDVTVKTYKGKNITSRLEVIGKVDTTKPGKYYLTYRAQDSEGNYASKEFIVTVKKSSKPVILGLKDTVTLKLSGQYITTYFKKGVTAYDRNGSSLTNKIKITYAEEYAKKGIIRKVDSTKLRFFRPGTYKVRYTVTGSKGNGAKTTSKIVRFKIQDNTLPVITNKISTESVYIGSEYGKTQILNGISAATKFRKLTSAITYTVNGKTAEAIDTSAAGTYTIKYNVAGECGKKAKEVKRVVTVLADTPKVTITNSDEIQAVQGTDAATLEAAIYNGVQFSTASGKDISSTAYYEIYRVDEAGNIASDALALSNLTPGKYKVYLFCKNPTEGSVSEKTEEAVKSLVITEPEV